MGFMTVCKINTGNGTPYLHPVIFDDIIYNQESMTVYETNDYTDLVNKVNSWFRGYPYYIALYPSIQWTARPEQKVFAEMCGFPSTFFPNYTFQDYAYPPTAYPIIDINGVGVSGMSIRGIAFTQYCGLLNYGADQSPSTRSINIFPNLAPALGNPTNESDQAAASYGAYLRIPVFPENAFNTETESFNPEVFKTSTNTIGGVTGNQYNDEYLPHIADLKVTYYPGNRKNPSFETNTYACEIAYHIPQETGTWRKSDFICPPELTNVKFTDKLGDDTDDTNDPYEPGGTSGPGGGTGNLDGTSVDIDIPALPTLSAVDTGFITLFNPSIGQLKNLASYMWSTSLFNLETWQKLFADPMDAILGLSIVPVAVPDGGISDVTVGNISTGISMTKAARQYVAVDCGTLNVNEYWGAYLDYDPYTKTEIYLPYIGTHAISTDDIMNKTLHVVYHIDILSGACCAFLQCGGTVLYQFIGQCASSIPISGGDMTSIINGVLSIAGAVGSMVATGGASAPLAVSAVASTAVNSMKPNIEKSGGMSGTGGMLGVQVPYIIITRPNQAVPSKLNTFTGYPSFITRSLSEISGYTEVEMIHLENIPATGDELDEIDRLLKQGVIL